MKTFNNLPLYEISVDGDIQTDEGVDAVAFVDRPAIKRGFLAFRENAPKPMAFAVTSEERHILTGPLMLADTPIYRSDEDGEYYITFPKSAIECIVRKFFTLGNQANANLMHDAKRPIEGAVMFESWITDAARGVPPMKGYEDAPEGSWFGSFYVDNEEAWAGVKSGEFTGFSVEGIFARLIPQKHRAPWADEPGLSAEEAAELAELDGFLKNL